MSVASLIGEKMFNFAELTEKEFFKVLKDSPNNQWIYDLIISFNSARVDEFIRTMQKYSDRILADKDLKDRVRALELKIRIAALLELAFHKNKNERVLTYKDISQNCQCSPDDIELLVIKALSLGIIKGHIDEVENKVVVNWVQPRFLEKEKVQILYDRVDNWINKSVKVLGNFQETAHQLLV
jgi:26S proteasome regulatory subunit N9